MLHRMSDAKTRALAQVPLFRNCTERELGFIASRTDEVTVPAGKTLIKQGEPGEAFYILLDGEAEVDIDGKPRRTLKAGEFFGEISMLDRGAGTATVLTKTPVKLMVMSHSQFRDAIKADDSILVKVLQVMGQRLRADLAAKEGGRTG
jgi:CRP-like cAMP-binding protein